MTSIITKLIAFAVSLVYFSCALAATDGDNKLCSDLSPLVIDSAAKTTDPSRYLNQAEQVILDKANLELLEFHDYSDGAVIVDADDDNIDDLLVWNIQGSGRFTYTQVYALSEGRLQAGEELTLKFSLNLGVLSNPRLVRFKGHNYFVYSDSGGSDRLSVSRIQKIADQQYEEQVVCSMQTILKAETTCKHSACKELKDVIENRDKNEPFINVEWPHKYFPPAGVEVFYSNDWSTGDFDNSGMKSAISRFGRRGYIYQNIYWSLLGLDVDESQIDSSLQPAIEENEPIRSVLPGQQHDRLRNTLDQQSKVLSVELKQEIMLPKSGEFFLFNANHGRTYWAWDFDTQPYGRELHIVYSNTKNANYIGLVKVSHTLQLEPCTKNCNTSLNEPPELYSP